MISKAIDEFVRGCVVAIARGEGLSTEHAAAFARYLAAKEAAGHRFLGPYDGGDEPFDTVTGRCGHQSRNTNATNLARTC